MSNTIKDIEARLKVVKIEKYKAIKEMNSSSRRILIIFLFKLFNVSNQVRYFIQ